MLGHNKCLICKAPNPYSSTNEANRQGWGKLILRNDYYKNSGYKYIGLVCPNCAWNRIKPLYFDSTADMFEEDGAILGKGMLEE